MIIDLALRGAMAPNATLSLFTSGIACIVLPCVRYDETLVVSIY